ncbi:MAG TPA: S9 family peptidase [Terriglobales bacterium]|nr:S9 family peptidase [Terriglobales bacterium]
MGRRILIVVSLLSSFCLAQAKRPFTFEDMMALQRVGEPQVSPDGRWVAFSAVKVDLKANTRTPHLWVVPLAGGASRQVTTGVAGEDRPRWSPDGKQLAYISAQDGSSQVWAVDFDGNTGALTGEPRRVTSISTEAGGELWSPDGQNILFVSSVYPDCKDDACNKTRAEEKAMSKVKASVFTGLFYRHWSGYTGGKRSHLFVVPASGGVARDLTPGDHDVPPFQLGGGDLYTFSPDGKEVAFTSNISEVEATSTNNDLFLVPVTGGTPKKITDNPASDSTPRYSPDGKYIAYLAQARPGYESDRFRLMLYDRATGQRKSLTESFDRWVGGFVWAPDSSDIYFVAEDKGEQPIYVVSVNGGDVRQLERHTNDDLNVTPNGNTLVFTRMSVRFPNEIYKLELVKDGVLQCGGIGTSAGCGTCKVVSTCAANSLTHLNDAVLSQLEMPPLQHFWFTGAEKRRVEGFLLKPPGFDPHKKYPVKFLIHGGPQGAWGDAWSYRWNPELFAADGYVVVMINPRGSTGYGQRFIDQINGDWGGRPYVDLMRGLDYVERRYPFVDKNLECALGASYGGYMVNWILGHTTRFKCLVSHDGTFNTESAYGTTEELWFPEWEFKGTPWTNRLMYRRWSPHLFAANFKTPTLVVHGQLDYRLDVSEGFQLFTTLQRLGVPSKMLYFPDEGHWVLKPQNSQLWYKTVNQWVDSWVKR